jgi:hypothetical protein
MISGVQADWRLVRPSPRIAPCNERLKVLASIGTSQALDISALYPSNLLIGAYADRLQGEFLCCAY